ncbi:tRNA1(Val) (adenine(37)-N6)-methyltransferase [Roseicitreum antarcticum]|uniref:tRNA1(Val) A37 N6-methylase TrmN6 n=1 Tax=Roseicitreum antarcticum TaxID=564137 RepID=A0A1H2SBK2_9RHOB|nr:methyltransferase [Roseicitreum antarcticum]SDW28504.1 tRNA1(Val) A37 N6-methylase TrmN6 [Roseicitreum antarcticum]
MNVTDAALSRDAFLDGRVMAWQPRVGYRAATDPVFLAAALPAQAGDAVLELGCGVGVASLCLAHRVPGLVHAALELQTDYAVLARRNADEAGVALDVLDGDVARPPAVLRGRVFDHVFANPPYYDAGGPQADDPGRDRALREATPLATWVDTALRRTRPGGWITLIHLTTRLPDLLAALSPRAGAITVLPLAARQGQAARRVIVRARKGARSPFTLLPPFVIHDGAAHMGDGDSFTPAARSILRDGAAFAFETSVPRGGI